MTDPRAALVEEAFADRAALGRNDCREAVLAVVADLDAGRLRVATPGDDGDWIVHAWVQKAVSLYFAVAPMEEHEAGPLRFHDKVPIKRNLAAAGVRVVPGGVVRHGAFCERGVVVMPALVNIGAWVGAGTMVDTWATVGSGAQIGRGVHLSGGVGIGGVLEPPGARPVIIEDDCFVGSRCIVVEGVHVGRGAVLGANTVLTASTHVIDVRAETPVTIRGHVPAGAVVIPGTRPKTFPAGTYQVPCALWIGQRSESTDKKTSLNETLRSFAL
jgi:2,3,4,5-tetrahydropyridine-2-carboxylate N-succinyltransferase